MEYNVDLAVWNVEKATTKDVGSARSSCPFPSLASLTSWDNLGLEQDEIGELFLALENRCRGFKNLYISNYAQCHVLYNVYYIIYKAYGILIYTKLSWQIIQSGNQIPYSQTRFKIYRLQTFPSNSDASKLSNQL